MRVHRWRRAQPRAIGQVNGSLLSDADDKVHALRIMLEEFVAAFGLDILPPKALPLQQIDRNWMHLARGTNSGAKDAEILPGPSIHNSLGDNAASGVVVTDK